MRHLILILIAGALAACGESAPEPVNTNPQSGLEPGASPSPAADPQTLRPEGWGPLRIGMTKAEIESALGPDSAPNAVGGNDVEVCDIFHPQRAPEGLLVMLTDGRLSRITLMRDAPVETSEGLKIGASAADVLRAYGQRAQTQPHKYIDAPAQYVTVWTAPRPSGEPFVDDPSARGVRYEIGIESKVVGIHAGDRSIQNVEGCA